MSYIPIPAYTETKYLGFILDKKLTWAAYIKNKRKILDTSLHLLKPLLRSKNEYYKQKTNLQIVI